MPFTFDFQRPDRTLLKDFFSQLRAFLQTLTDEPSAYADDLILLEGAHQELQSMWEDPGMSDAFENAISFTQIGPEDQLRSAGLTGVQLQGKLSVIQRWGSRLLGDRFVKYLRRLLDAINSLLGTLAGFVPGADFIMEFKECFENNIDD